MGKNHRHKKNIKADKVKVKLKQVKTKFLPKGLNETQASFKIKPIILPEQLKARSTDIPLSRRKLNVKDLCTRINHYNENVRSLACEELTDLYKHYSEEIIREYLSEIILNVSNLMQDRERKVRTAAIKAVATILEVTPSEKLEPFFNYFATNMRCAMTNIDQSIQEDSLKFLDCFLNINCSFISKTSDKFLPDFFTLISRLRSENNLGRTLTLNLGSKMTAVTWRIKVLSRLHTVLDLILKKKENVEERHLDYMAISSNNFPIYKIDYFNSLNNSGWDDSVNISSKNVLDTHISTLIPVFYDIWLEVVPEKKVKRTSNSSTILSEEAAAILWNVVNTVYLLWKYSDSTKSDLKNIFVTLEATKFLNHLLQNFPYSRGEIQSKSRVKSSKSNVFTIDMNTDSNCVKENIIICYIYFVLNATFTRNSAKRELESVANYINKCLLTKNYVNANNVDYVIDFIKVSLLDNCNVWKKSSVDAKRILENVMIFYNSESISEKSKMKLFKMFPSFVDNPYLLRSYYQDWLSSLSDLLCEPKISDTTTNILLELSRKNSEPFIKSIKSNLYKILKNLDSVTIILHKKNYKDEDTVKREIAFIFYYIKGFTCNEINDILKCFSKFISSEDCHILKEQLYI